jgi:hypothetical protein
MSEPETISNQSAAADHAHATGGSSVNQIRITDSKWWLLVAMAVGVNLVATVAMYTEKRTAEREARMLEYYLLELDAKFIGAGLKKPDDAIARKLKEK